MAKCKSCLHFDVCERYDATVDFDVDDGVCLYYEHQIVRCKDCKHHYWEQEPCHGKTVHYCELPHMRGVEVFKEFFCYYGERKDGDD